MVTSNKLTDKKVVRMTEQNNSSAVPQRTLLGEVNEHITCPICRGYYIDATTIVECLHSFCRSCIIKHLQIKSYCPVCEMMINSAKPNIKLDKALQDIVYKLVPGLFQREMERRQQFYASRPGTAASATPEQRGEDTERIIFSPEDVISFSLEYADVTDTDSVSSKSSDASNEAQTNTATSRRYLQCPAVVNISHLKKFLSMKFNIDCSQFAVDILYKRVPLPDYYTLMDIAYIYNWKRNEPMRFFYQMIDYVAIRNRLFDINRKGSHFDDEKTADDTANSPAPNFNEHGGEELTSGTDSPVPKDNQSKHSTCGGDRSESHEANRCIETPSKINKSDIPKPDEEVEKSQFLNSFELTAKSNSTSSKSLSPVKSTENKAILSKELENKTSVEVSKELKRKQAVPQSMTEMKKIKIEIEKANISSILSTTTSSTTTNNLKSGGELKASHEISETTLQNASNANTIMTNTTTNENKNDLTTKHQNIEISGMKRPMAIFSNTSSPKRKPTDSNAQSTSVPQKTISPLKLQLPKTESQHQRPTTDVLVKPHVKKMPDLKPSVAGPQSTVQNKLQIPKLRMDLLANNSDPTIDRSKILCQVKSTLGSPPTLPTPGTGDPLRSLFDSCKINIPSSLSITLTDQKLDSRNPTETANTDTKKNIVNKNLSTANTSTHKVPSPPVHNYIEILKLPESDAKKQNKNEGNTEQKTPPTKLTTTELTSSQAKQNRSSESSAKGPVPNLKPISDTKHGKASGNNSSPITFQQTFEKQLQSLHSDKKPKTSKTKAQVPKLVPASSKAFTAAVSKLNQNKPNPGSSNPTEIKTNIALDLSTAPNIQQSKAFETMQSIANLAKKQGLTAKGQSGPQSNNYTAVPSRPINTTSDSVRMPLTINQIKLDKMGPSAMQSNNGRQDPPKPIQLKPAISPSILSSPLHGIQPIPTSNTSSQSQPSPRSQTRSPSCSPKLIIAEEKQPNTPSESNINQSNQISSTQQGVPVKSDSPKATPGPSKPTVKSLKPVPSANKITGIRQPITPTMNPVMSPTIDYLSQPQLMAHHALLRHQMEMQTAWLKARHDLLKNMSNIAHQNQNDFNNKDKQ